MKITTTERHVMSVQARFYVAEITRRAYNPGAAELTLQAATRGEENKVWASATPAGQIKMTVNNEAATAVFQRAFDNKSDVAVAFTIMDDPE